MIRRQNLATIQERKRITPIKLMMLRVSPVMMSARTTPISESGSEMRMASGFAGRIDPVARVDSGKGSARGRGAPACPRSGAVRPRPAKEHQCDRGTAAAGLMADHEPLRTPTPMPLRKSFTY